MVKILVMQAQDSLFNLNQAVISIIINFFIAFS